MGELQKSEFEKDPWLRMFGLPTPMELLFWTKLLFRFIFFSTESNIPVRLLEDSSDTVSYRLGSGSLSVSTTVSTWLVFLPVVFIES